MAAPTRCRAGRPSVCAHRSWAVPPGALSSSAAPSAPAPSSSTPPPPPPRPAPCLSPAKVPFDRCLHGSNPSASPPLPPPLPAKYTPPPIFSFKPRRMALASRMTADRKTHHDATKQPQPPLYMPINLNYPGLERLHEKPPIFLCHDFLTEEECAALIETAGPLLQRSKTHAVAGSEATKGRTSLTCHLAKKVHPCPILLQKIHMLTGKPFGHMELPQVARYTDSQRYVEHYDGVDPHTEAGRAFCANGGQRIATVLVYLNHVREGGSTYFRRLNVDIRPKKGAAVIFFPGFMNGELDTDALHAGMPAVDTKWVSQVWIRQSFREDGQPSQPVPLIEQTLVGPLHEGVYRGHCLAGDDIHEAVMTISDALAWAQAHPTCFGFTWQSPQRNPQGPLRIWFKSKLNVLYNEEWWTYSLGRGMD